MCRTRQMLVTMLLAGLLVLSITPGLAQEVTPEPTAPTEITPEPTIIPVETEKPTEAPTAEPTKQAEATPELTPEITEAPTVEVTPEVTLEATVEITPELTAEATVEATPEITPEVTATQEVTPEITEEPATEIRLINYNPQASEESVQAMLAALGAVEIERISQIGTIKARVPLAVAEPSGMMSALSSDRVALSAGVRNIEVDSNDYTLSFTPNDTLFSDPGMWGLKDGVGGTHATTAWDLSPKDGQGVIVAVIDSGVDLQHPDLAGQFVAGWDFWDDDSDPDDTNGHGTHVAGTIAAKTNNALGVAGVAFKAKILPIRASDGPTGFFVYTLAKSIVYAVDRGAKVINLSMAGPSPSTTLQAAIEYALARNVTVVAAAGNDGIPASYYPASFPGVISVAAHDNTGTVAAFSQKNSLVTVSAPGVAILSTCVANPTPPNLPCDSEYDTLQGTSMAAPHVAGIVALLYGDGKVVNAQQATEALICSATDAGTAGKDNFYGYGRVRADLALSWYSNVTGCHVPQLNDKIENATAITKVPTTITQQWQVRGVTTSAGDVQFCGTGLQQTLWYSFKPKVNDYYQITTIGSTFDTAIGVFQGTKGEFTMVHCNDDAIADDLGDPNDYPVFQSALVAEMKAGQTYYIAARGFSGLYDDAILKLDVRRIVSTMNADIQENNVGIYYAGTWINGGVPGASGGKTQQTTDNSAFAVFSFRGVQADFYRTTGPIFGSTLIHINGAETELNNRAPLQAANQPFTPAITGTAGTIQTVIVRRASRAGFPVGGIDIDRFRLYESSTIPASPVTSLTDDRVSAKIKYSGVWTQQPVTGSYANTITRTTAANAEVTFRATGSTITIFRNTDPSFGTMNVYVDGVLYGPINNNSPTAKNVPYVIGGLANIQHVVRVVNIGGTLEFDAAQAANPAIFNSSFTAIDDRKPGIVYSGIWTSVSDPVALNKTLRVSTDPDASVWATFNGNNLCVYYTQKPGFGTFEVFVDGVPAGSQNTSGLLQYRMNWCSAVFSDRQHVVEIQAASGEVELDYFLFWRIPVINPSNNLVAENVAGSYYVYQDSWLVTKQASPAGYKFQGGAAKYTTSDGGTVDFYVNGTGFILYTAVGPNEGEWIVWVDGVRQNFTVNGAVSDFIDLDEEDGVTWPRFQPTAIGVSGLTPGIHYVLLEAATPDVGDRVHFDGVRAIP